MIMVLVESYLLGTVLHEVGHFVSKIIVPPLTDNNAADGKTGRAVSMDISEWEADRPSKPSDLPGVSACGL